MGPRGKESSIVGHFRRISIGGGIVCYLQVTIPIEESPSSAGGIPQPSLEESPPSQEKAAFSCWESLGTCLRPPLRVPPPRSLFRKSLLGNVTQEPPTRRTSSRLCDLSRKPSAARPKKPIRAKGNALPSYPKKKLRLLSGKRRIQATRDGLRSSRERE